MVSTRHLGNPFKHWSRAAPFRSPSHPAVNHTTLTMFLGDKY
jgi:hypothetical protein